ncbi:Na/Pi cotransporter family protein [Pelagibacterium limicola]|uniref:Na/Pi cotransporter family protein n=1 Tax=Pelagibacterium limicola TaxID=2791022 RepID=UPI0018B007A3|nr:Na/Pi symporter [Pelagibacterium limicola]
MEIWASLLGGIGLFLLGMRLMTDGLTRAAGAALKSGLATATGSPLRGLAVGVVITAIVQSSSAVTVAAIGFANAGLMTLTNSVWVIYGTNVGTTMTGWLVATLGIKIDVAALALPLLGLGMAGRLMARSRPRTEGAGEALAGFGAFFLGISVLQSGFVDLAPHVAEISAPFAGTGWELPVFVLLGVVLTTLTQSSSAAIAIALTAGAGGTLSLEQAAATIVGTNIGTTSTALFASIGATATAKRVAVMHIIFNLLTGVFTFFALPLLLLPGIWLSGGGVDVPVALAVFHTSFNLLGVVLIWPLTPWLVSFLSRRFEKPHEDKLAPRHLDNTLFAVPDLALSALVMEMDRLSDATYALVHHRLAGYPADEPAAADVLKLRMSVRDYLAQMNRGALDDRTVEALSNVLRGLHHLEDLAEATLRLPERPDPATVGLAPMAFAMVADITGQSCQRAEGPDAAKNLDALGAASEDAYAAVKAALLRAAVSGAMPMTKAEAALTYARAVRGLGTTARKAQKRLLPWRAEQPAPTLEEAPLP